MSSLRPAKIAAAMFQLIGGSLADRAEPEGPACGCPRCAQAWRRYQSPGRVSARTRVANGLTERTATRHRLQRHRVPSRNRRGQ